MKFIDEEKIENKKVILRCDFNVPIENGKVLDDTKVVKSLKTINYLLDNNCSLILLSHLGRVKSKKDKIEKDIADVKKKVGESDAVNSRYRILRFDDELLHDVKHSKEHFDQILHDIDVYEKYCNEHRDFENNIALMAIKHIKVVYQNCIENNKFL